MPRIFSKEELKSFQHPKENSRFILALLVVVPVSLTIFFLVFLSFGTLLLGLLILTGLMALIYAFVKAQLMANAVRVSANNFPEIQAIAEEVKATLAFQKKITIFVIQEGNLNAFLASFFKMKFIIINSGMIEEMQARENLPQLKWLIARFVGNLKAKHMRLDLFKILIDSIENFKVFNFFIYPYERAAQFTGDNIGLMVCENLEQAMITFDKWLVGNKLANRVDLKGLLEQKEENNENFLVTLSRWFSTHPHLLERYLNLLAFAKVYMPQEYRSFINKLDARTAQALNLQLPAYYQKRMPMRTYTTTVNRSVSATPLGRHSDQGTTASGNKKKSIRIYRKS